MKRNRATSLLLLCGLCAALPIAYAANGELTITEALRRVELASPDLKSAMAQEEEAKGNVGTAKSSYYPTLDFQAIQSYGFAGSNAALGMEGLVGSPYRKGPAAGLVSKLTLIDFARHSGVESAQFRLKSVEAQTQIVRFKLDQAVLQIYFEASRFRGQQEAWAKINQTIDRVAKEVSHLIQTGQHAAVEGYLMDDQVEEAAMAQTVFAERYQNALQRLALLTGLDEKTISCPTPSALSESDLNVIRPGSESPLIVRAGAEEKVARTEVSRSSGGNYPRINALASVGDVSETFVVPKMDYSGGFGFDFPIFEGFRVASDIHRAQALANEKNNDLLAARLEVDELNAHYDDIIGSSRIRMGYLERELDAAQKALDSAWHRYLSFLGPLVEVREASRNLARIQTQINEVKADLLLAIASKSLLNGGSIR